MVVRDRVRTLLSRPGARDGARAAVPARGPRPVAPRGGPVPPPAPGALARRLLCCGALALGAQPALAQVRPAAPAATQVRPTNEATRCTLITDPTAQRACIESSLLSRPAQTFDPTVQQPRPGRVRPPDKAGAGRAAGAANIDAGPGAPAAKPASEAYRDTKWRLQIP